MCDTKTKELIWSASVEDMLSDKAEKNENRQNGVAKMFGEFPPGLAKG